MHTFYHKYVKLKIKKTQSFNLNYILFVHNAPLRVIHVSEHNVVCVRHHYSLNVHISSAAKFTMTATMTAERFSDDGKCWASCSVIQK